jgi:hypothetical protein
MSEAFTLITAIQTSVSVKFIFQLNPEGTPGKFLMKIEIEESI